MLFCSKFNFKGGHRSNFLLWDAPFGRCKFFKILWSGKPRARILIFVPIYSLGHGLSEYIWFWGWNFTSRLGGRSGHCVMIWVMWMDCSKRLHYYLELRLVLNSELWVKIHHVPSLQQDKTKISHIFGHLRSVNTRRLTLRGHSFFASSNKRSFFTVIMVHVSH